jgi:L-fuculose-phosphate aldolase
MDINMLHPADQLVMIMERIYGYGMTTTSGGNLSILDDNGDIWITPGGVDKGSLTRKDIVCVKSDGTIVGNHKPSSEYLFHKKVYEARPDIKAVLHAHPPALVAFSIVRKIPNTKLIPNVHLVCGQVGMAKYGLPGSLDLGEKIAEVFKQGINTVVLENHGIVVGAKTLFRAFKSFETLDFCARLEIDANKIGAPNALTEEEIQLSETKRELNMSDFTPRSYTSKEKAARREMCDLIHRAYDQQLFTSTQGTFSQRIEGNTFIITPYSIDRKYIDVEDIVRVENGYKESGKNPSRSVELHKAIYEKHPEINSIIIAHPPNVMAFVVSDQILDSKTIPESYILMRNIPKLPFGASFIKPKETAEVFNESTPIVMVKNDCIIVTGNSLLNAFDRLEVSEYSAKAIIASKNLGSIVAINQEQIDEIEVAFNLK